MNHQEKNINNLKIIINSDYTKMSKYASNLIIKEIKKKPELLLCAATGDSPTETYQLLNKKYKKNPQIFKKIKILKLDEWGGIPLNNPATCETYLQNNLIKPLNIDKKRFFSFESNLKNPQKEIIEIKKNVDKLGKIDLCILGIGINGHLAFNEPNNFLESSVHITKLKKTTTQHSMAKKSKKKIDYGISLGMSNIMQSKKIILLINGSHKKEILKKFLSQKIDTNLPASMLWMHNNVILICDKKAYFNSLQ